MKALAGILSALTIFAILAFVGLVFGAIWTSNDEITSNLADSAFFVLFLIVVPLAGGSAAAGAKAGWWKL